MLSLESQCGFYASSTSPFGLKTFQVLSATCDQWLLDSAALSITTALKEEPQPSAFTAVPVRLLAPFVQQ